eukprot:811135-Prymnesium_polylepis.1
MRVEARVYHTVYISYVITLYLNFIISYGNREHRTVATPEGARNSSPSGSASELLCAPVSGTHTTPSPSPCTVHPLSSQSHDRTAHTSQVLRAHTAIIGTTPSSVEGDSTA